MMVLVIQRRRTTYSDNRTVPEHIHLIRVFWGLTLGTKFPDNQDDLRPSGKRLTKAEAIDVLFEQFDVTIRDDGFVSHTYYKKLMANLALT